MLTKSSPSLARRALLALALTVVFYAFATALGVALMGLPVYQIATGGWFNIWIAFTLFFTGGTILYAIFPRRQKFEAPGPELEASDHPRLFAMIEEVAKAAGQEMPAHVYLDHDVNAAVTETGGFLGMGSRKVLLVGLPLMATLTEPELKAVVAHEFGHYAGQDTKFGAWTWRTRAAIFRTLGMLRDEDDDSIWNNAISKPFEWYAKLFLRLTTAVSRRQEFAADEVAATVAGRDAHVSALRRIHRLAPAFDAYWFEDVVPAIENGGRTPIAAGWARFLDVPPVKEALAERYAKAVAEERQSDPYSSHPTVVERLAAFDADPEWPEGEPVIPAKPSTCLFESLDAAERRLVTWMTVDGLKLEEVAWEEVGEKLQLPQHRKLATGYADELKGLTVAGAVEWLVRGRPHDRAFTSAEANFDEARATAAGVIASAIIAALADEGFTLESLPGEPVRCRRGEHTLEPFNAIGAAIDGKLTPEEWQAQCEAAGVADVSIQPRSAEMASATENLRS
jgi:Zn-dependent protease with chaperone function